MPICKHHFIEDAKIVILNFKEFGTAFAQVESIYFPNTEQCPLHLTCVYCSVSCAPSRYAFWYFVLSFKNSRNKLYPYNSQCEYNPWGFIIYLLR